MSVCSLSLSHYSAKKNGNRESEKKKKESQKPQINYFHIRI